MLEYVPDIIKDLNFCYRNTSIDKIQQDLVYVESIGIHNGGPLHRTKRNDRDSFLVVATMKGCGIIEYRGKKYEVPEGKGFFIDCMETHLYYSNKQNWRYMFIHMNGIYVRNLYKHLMGPEFFAFDFADFPGFLKCCYDLPVYVDNPCRNSSLSAISILTDILNHVSRSCLPAKEYFKDIEPAIRYIEDHFHEEISINQLALVCACSQATLSRKFRKAYRISPHQYLKNYRVKVAKNLLSNTDLSIEEIGYECGYNYTSFFIRAFQSSTGYTPLGYRKKAKKL